MPSDAHDLAATRSYGRRRGKHLRLGRVTLLETLLPRLALATAMDAAAPAPLFAAMAEAPRSLWLEIGFGGGEHLAAQAALHPTVGFIGCEVFLNGIASALRHIDAGGLDNVRLYTEDARALLAALPVASVDRVFLLFPDPWPKKRHARRRFVSPANLDALARVLVDDGELRIATDDVTYLRWILAHAPVHPGFRWIAAGPQDWREPPSDWVPTRYEAKAIEAGRRPFYLRFRRRPRD